MIALTLYMTNMFSDMCQYVAKVTPFCLLLRGSRTFFLGLNYPYAWRRHSMLRLPRRQPRCLRRCDEYHTSVSPHNNGE